MDALHQGGARTLRVVGIHLGGSQTSRSAVVRGHFAIRRLCPPEQAASVQREAWLSWLTSLFPGVVTVPLSGASAPGQCGEGLCSPFVVDSFVHSLGPERDRDGDTRLMEVISDLGSADCYVIDGPLGLPPCTGCLLVCPGASSCQVDEVERTFDLWRSMRKRGARFRAPQPYLDRYWDYFGRHVLEGAGHGLRGEFESPMGSNRAPLAARARYLSQVLQGRLGISSTRILETQSTVSAWAWHAAAHRSRAEDPSGIVSAAAMRAERSGQLLRKTVVDFLVSSGRLGWGANLSRSLLASGRLHPEVFLATMSALTLRCLGVGEVFVQDDFLLPFLEGKGGPWLPASAGLLIAGARDLRLGSPTEHDEVPAEGSSSPGTARNGRLTL